MNEKLRQGLTGALADLLHNALWYLDEDEIAIYLRCVPGLTEEDVERLSEYVSDELDDSMFEVFAEKVVEEVLP